MMDVNNHNITSSMDPEDIKSRTLALYRELEQNPRSRDRNLYEIYSLNEGIAHAYAQFASQKTHIDYEDILQQSLMGLWIAVKTFDIKITSVFSSYARKKCRSEVLHFRRDKGLLVKAPRNFQEATDAIRTKVREHNTKFPDNPMSEIDMASLTYGWSEEEWHTANNSTKRGNTSSLDCGEGEIPLTNGIDPMKQAIKADEVGEKHTLLARCLARLPEDEADLVLAHQLGGMPYKAIAQLYGKKPNDVKKIITKAMQQLQEVAA